MIRRCLRHLNLQAFHLRVRGVVFLRIFVTLARTQNQSEQRLVRGRGECDHDLNNKLRGARGAHL